MNQEQICAKCQKNGVELYSRCGHILHEKWLTCFYYENQCPVCKTRLSKSAAFEQMIRKIKLANLDFDTAEELIYCVEKFASYESRIYSAPISYDSSILEHLQRLGWDINSYKFKGGELFYRACITDDIDKVNMLIEHGLNLDIYGPKGLHYAITYSSHDVFERLRQLEVKYPQDIIFELIRLENFGMLKRIVELGADVNKRPIHAAAENGSISIFEFLIANGAEISAVDNAKNSILHYSCVSSCGKNIKKIIEYFIESGFDFTKKNKNQMTPLMLAIERKNCFTAAILILKGLGVEKMVCKNRGTILHWCAIENDVALMKALIIEGADVNAKDENGKTPLHVIRCESNFYSYKKFDMIGLLLGSRADVNALDNYGKSPLYYLHHNLEKTLIRRFIDAGADLTIKNEKGQSILELLLNNVEK